MKALFVFFFSLLYNCCAAQTVCNCPVNFDTVAASVETNYAGYVDRLSQTGEATYKRFTDSLRTKAAQATSTKACFHLIAAYVRFFNDLHMQFSYHNKADWSNEYVYLTEAQAKQALRKPAAPVAGIWQTTDSLFQIAILPDAAAPARFKAIVMKSPDTALKAGRVYFTVQQEGTTYRITPYNQFSSTPFQIQLNGNLLHALGRLWMRRFPQQPALHELKLVARQRQIQNGLYFEKIAADAAYLKIESFANNDAAIAAFVKQHDSVIRSTPYLVVDLRGNGGGSSGWISIAPYFYTQPFKQGITYTRLSPTNRAALKESLKAMLSMPIEPEMKRYFTNSFMARKRREAAALDTASGDFFPVEAVRIPFDSVLRYPKRLALLVDKGTGSSSEFFLHLSKQSSKAISFGTHTMGIMDYVGQPVRTALPCDAFYLAIPTEKSDWTTAYLTNATGMKPDMLLDSIPDEKWIDAALKVLRGKPVKLN